MNINNSDSSADSAKMRGIAQVLQVTSRQKMALRVGLVVIGLIVAISIWRGLSYGRVAASDGDSEVVNAAPVRAFPVRESKLLEMKRTYTGVVKPTQTSPLGFELGGEVESLYVNEGDVLKAGQAIAQLDQRRLIAKRDEVSAQLASAKALLSELNAGPRVETIKAARAQVNRLDIQLQLAKIKLERRRTLADASALSVEELDEQEFQVEALQAQVDEASARLDELSNGTRKDTVDAQDAVVSQLEAALRQAEIEIDHSNLVAPFDGVVVERMVDNGTIVSTGQPVVQVESLGREIWIGCPPEVAADLDESLEYEVNVGEETYQVEILTIIPHVRQSTRTQTVIFELPVEAQSLPSGMIAELSVTQTIEEPGFWVPVTALSPGSHGLWAAYVLGEEEDGLARVNRRDVELVHLEGHLAFVRGTLDEGDQMILADDEVILEGVHRLGPGQLVKPTRVSTY